MYNSKTMEQGPSLRVKKSAGGGSGTGSKPRHRSHSSAGGATDMLDDAEFFDADEEDFDFGDDEVWTYNE